MGRPVRRVLFRGLSRGLPSTAISLGDTLPCRSSGLPEDSAGRVIILCLTLLRTRFTWRAMSPWPPVVSYTTLSPLPFEPFDELATAVFSLWHCLADRSGWVLPTVLPCGARTFLGAVSRHATVRPTHSPAQSTSPRWPRSAGRGARRSGIRQRAGGLRPP